MPSSLDRLCWPQAPSCEIHSLYKLFFKEKKNGIIYHEFFIRPICLFGHRSPRRNTHVWPRLLPSVDLGAICTRLQAAQHCLSEPSTGSSAELGPQPSPFPFCSGVLEPPSARAKDPTLSALGCRHQHPQCASTVGPCGRIGQPRGEEAESTFWETSCLPLDRVHRRPGRWSTGDEGFFISSSAGNSGFICPRPF